MRITRSRIVAVLQLFIITLIIGYWIYQLSWRKDVRNWAILLTLPIFFCFIIFPLNYLVNNLVNIFWPAWKLEENSKYYIHHLDTPMPRKCAMELTIYDTDTHIIEHHDIWYDGGYQWPLLTIQIPIYKEPFKEVIIPTIENAMAARALYLGPCNILVCDDGYALQTPEEQDEKRKYYKDNNIGWVARGCTNRRGKFKKASNLNHSLQLIKDKYPNSEWLLQNTNYVPNDSSSYNLAMENGVDGASYDINDSSSYDLAIQNGIDYFDCTYVNNNINNIDRCIMYIDKYLDTHHYGLAEIGKYIILIDSDSRIDTSHINNAIWAMEERPNVAFIQFKTRALGELQNYNIRPGGWFQWGVEIFTNNLFEYVFPLVARGGEPAPFVGHNGIIRWSVLQEIGIVDNSGSGLIDGDDMPDMYWHEDRVSEDFDFAVRVQLAGYIGTYGMCAGIWQEGVSMTYHDELLKYSKFAYGASEILFSREFWCDYIWGAGDIPWDSKLNLTAYLITYFAIASSLILAPLHIVLMCLVPEWDLLVVGPFGIMLVSLILFSILGPLATTCFLVRSDKRPVLSLESHKWWNWNRLRQQLGLGIFLFMFYLGAPYAIGHGLVSQWLGLRAGWGATVKVLDNGRQIWHNVILGDFRGHYIFMGVYSIVCLGIIWGWIDCWDWLNTLPLLLMIVGHLLNPILFELM